MDAFFSLKIKGIESIIDIKYTTLIINICLKENDNLLKKYDGNIINNEKTALEKKVTL